MNKLKIQRVWLQLWAAIFLSVALSACAIFSSQQEPVKSQSDQRLYRSLVLGNGLKVLLISDNKAERSAASLDVFAGSAQNPISRPGLAHFLEHMLFLGTEKYPTAGEYQKFIKDNGGSHNAYTSFEHTNYFFSIGPEAFGDALDRFSQFFISPLVDEQYVEREKHAVDAEFKASFKKEARRGLSVFRETINAEHPFSRFSVGNLESLSDNGSGSIRSDLIAFYERYYSASNMALAMVANSSLDDMEALVKDKFSEVPKFQVDDNMIVEPLFEKGQLPKWVRSESEKDKKMLTLVFPLDDQKAYYPDKSLELVAHILGHEGKGSLFSYLKNQGYVDALASGQFIGYQGGTVFSLSIALTNKGIESQEEVIEAVFSVLNMLKKKMPASLIFDDLAKINQLGFDYQDRVDEQQLVMHIASDLHYYSPVDVLQAPYKYEKFDPVRVKAILDQLTVENLYISTVRKGFSGDKHSKNYNVSYAEEKLPKSLIDRLVNAPAIASIKMPEKNLLLPENLQLERVDNKQQTPELIFEQQGIALWFKPLADFESPKAAMYFSFQKLGFSQSLEQQVLLSLYVELIKDSLNEWVYPAYLAGMSFDLYAHARGVGLKLTGFSDKQQEFLNLLFDGIERSQFTLDQFQRLKAMQIKQWKNELETSPYQKLLSDLPVELRKGAFSKEEKIKALEEVELKQLASYGKTFWQGVNVQALFNGNQSKEKSLSVIKSLKGRFKTSPGRDSLYVEKLPAKNKHKQIDSKHSDAAYLLYWQGRDNSIQAQANWLLLAKLLETGFYTQLRTEQQLGYVVFESYYPMLSVPALVFSIQSPRVKVAEIHRATTSFINQQLPSMGLLNAEQLAPYINGLQQRLTETPKNLFEQTDRYWRALAMGDSEFNRRKLIALSLGELTTERWQSFVEGLNSNIYSHMYLFSTPVKKAVNGFDSSEKNKGGIEYYQYQ